MSYIVESGASSSRRSRRRRALVTLGLVALMLFFAFWYAYSYYRASGRPAAKVRCLAISADKNGFASCIRSTASANVGYVRCAWCSRSRIFSFFTPTGTCGTAPPAARNVRADRRINAC